METVTHKKCLLLNADYAPFGLIDWDKAIVWGLKEQEYKQSYSIEIIDFYKYDFIQGTNKKFPVPAVARIKKFLKINNYSINFSRKNILIRDDYTCQYCYKKFNINELTYDHVIPKSKWKQNTSPTNWTNIVTCCIRCNRHKGNKTPSEANMRLKNIPIRPYKNNKFLPIIQCLSTIKEIPTEWSQYIPDSYNHT